MLERLWTSILELMAQVVTPDWGVLVGLIPVAIAILVVVVILRLFLMIAKAPPARRGKTRVKSKTPAGIHMPGPSFAPVFAGVGLFLVMLGLVFGGLVLALGVIALVLTLLYWAVPYFGGWHVDYAGTTMLIILGAAMALMAYVLVAGSSGRVTGRLRPRQTRSLN